MQWRKACLIGVGALIGCSSAGTEGPGYGGGTGGASGAQGQAGALIPAQDASTFEVGIPEGGGNPACPQETQFVYLISAGNELFKFNPPTLALDLVGVIQCNSLGTPFSMSVDRKGIAWVVFTGGKLYQVDTKTAACTATDYVANQHGFGTFGMGFSSDTVGAAKETLFVTQSNLEAAVQGLASIDTTTLELNPIANYDKVHARAEMTGTGDARLFGAFEGKPYVVAEIHKTTGQILSQAPQDAISYDPGGSNFAFAFWGGDFWLFVGPGTKTDIFHYKPSDGSTTLRITVPQQIVGAGVSTCAPLKPPA